MYYKPIYPKRYKYYVSGDTVYNYTGNDELVYCGMFFDTDVQDEMLYIVVREEDHLFLFYKTRGEEQIGLTSDDIMFCSRFEKMMRAKNGWNR